MIRIVEGPLVSDARYIINKIKDGTLWDESEYEISSDVKKELLSYFKKTGTHVDYDEESDSYCVECGHLGHIEFDDNFLYTL